MCLCSVKEYMYFSLSYEEIKDAKHDSDHTSIIFVLW